MITYGPEQYETARRFAHKAHGLQTRADKTTPYITHPLTVASLFHSHWVSDPTWDKWLEKRPDTDVWYGMALAVLHDVLEDTSVTEADFVAAGLYDLVPDLRVLTRIKGSSYLAYLLSIKEYRNVSVLPWLVKLCDIEHNQSDSIGLSTERRKHAQVKYELALHILHN